jgi:hypothetical protein
MGRIIGIRHRVKVTARGEARPTQVAILEGVPTPRLLNLETETDELDFLLNRLPVEWRDAASESELQGVQVHHLRLRALRKNEPEDGLVVRDEDGKKKVVQTPSAYEGYKDDDTVVMILGGSGDSLAFALSRRGEEIGAAVYRVPSFVLEAQRDGTKDKDANNLIALYRKDPDAFFRTEVRDREIIWMRETYRAREEAMKARLAAEARLRARFIGQIFRSPDGRYPEGLIEDLFKAARANDVICEALRCEQIACDREMTRAVEATEVWKRTLGNVTGCGSAIAARLIAAIQDIRRFSTPAKLRAYCGVHVMQGGMYGDRPHDKQFPRRRAGEIANWSCEARQGLYLLGDQFNRRPDSVWGQRLRTNKTALRARHPQVMCRQCDTVWIDGHDKKHTRVYTNAHIHNMGLWRTVTEFTTWLFFAWWDLYGGAPCKKPAWVDLYK